jgi:hypothetical protein
MRWAVGDEIHGIQIQNPHPLKGEQRGHPAAALQQIKEMWTAEA